MLTDDVPLRLADPITTHVYYDAGAPATTAVPHVENWVLDPNAVTIPAGKYVITRRSPSPTTQP